MLPTRVFLQPTLASVTPKVAVVILYSTGSCGAASYGYVDAELLLGLGLGCDACDI